MATVLVPVDGSPSAERALAHALVELDATTEILLLHVIPPVRIYGEVAVYVGAAQAHEMAVAESHAVLDPILARVRERGRPCRCRLMEGEIAETIARVAQAEHCQCIIMGTRGLGAIASLVMGSVAMKVVHLVDVPVTLIK
jgi:nucleotide-binding universal stress UspA family protein